MDFLQYLAPVVKYGQHKTPSSSKGKPATTKTKTTTTPKIKNAAHLSAHAATIKTNETGETNISQLRSVGGSLEPAVVSQFKSATLLGEARSMLDEGGKRVTEADIILQVLATRKLTSEQRRQYHQVVDDFKRDTKLCRMSSAYSGEFVGVKLRSKTPAHVYGSVILKVWKRWKRTKTNLNFPEYFEKYATNGEFAKAQRNQVKYLNAEEQRDHEAVFISGGKVRRSNSTRKFKQGMYMFVLENSQGKERLLLAQKQRGRTHHSSLSQGKACLSAGMLQLAKSGHIVDVQMDSGHYKPNHQQAQALVKFLSQPKKMGSRAFNVPLIEHMF